MGEEEGWEAGGWAEEGLAAMAGAGKAGVALQGKQTLLVVTHAGMSALHIKLNHVTAE